MFGCIYIPDFAVQAALCGESKKLPLALIDGPESLLRVVACNAVARAAGVIVGMTKLQAEACRIEVRQRAQEEEDSAHAILLDCAYRFSPRVEATSPGTIIIDLVGTERLLGDAKTIAERIRSHLAECGFESNVSIAANADAAGCAAKGFAGITITPAGQEAQRLGRLPIEILELEPDIQDVLDAWGIHDFNSLAVLPSIPLSERLGQYGLRLQLLAKGAVERELVLAEPPTSFEECAGLDEPIELLEPLSFILNRLLEDVTRRLVERSLATDHIEVDLTLETHSDRDVRLVAVAERVETQYQRLIKLPVPTQDPKVLLKLAQLDFAAHPPHAPVRRIRVKAIPARLRLTQMGLFQPMAPEPAKLEITIARLRALVGEQDDQGRSRVGFPGVLDMHGPDRFQVLPFNEKRKEAAAMPSNRLALRMFRPPAPARVEVSAEGAPVWISFQRRKGRVLHSVGPWRGAGDWWDSASVWMRDQYDIHLNVDDESALYRVYFDLARKQWFVEGMYD
jgi:protein ImuB